MLNDLENVIQNFFNQYGITVKSSNSKIATDQVIRLLADQIFLHIISEGNTPIISAESSKPTKQRKPREKQPDKPKRKYQKKPKITTETVEGNEGAV